MVESLDSVQPMNIDGQMNEHQKRLARASRFGIDPNQVAQPMETELVIGPDTAPEEMMDQLALGSAQAAAKIKECQEEIERIRRRHARFEEEITNEGKGKIKRLEAKIRHLRLSDKPEEIKDGAEIIEDSLYLYGTDYMSTQDIQTYFGVQFPGLEIKWINDSSCTLKFDSGADAQSAYTQYSVRPPAVQVGEEAAIDQRNFDERIGWRQSLGYHHSKKGWQTLWIRFATNMDTKKEDHHGKDSRYYRFQQRKYQDYRTKDGVRHNKDHKSSFRKRGIEKKSKPKDNMKRRGRKDSEKEQQPDEKDQATQMDREEIAVDTFGSAGLLKAETELEKIAAIVTNPGDE